MLSVSRLCPDPNSWSLCSLWSSLPLSAFVPTLLFCFHAAAFYYQCICFVFFLSLSFGMQLELSLEYLKTTLHLPPFMFLPLSHTSPPYPLFIHPFPSQVRNKWSLKHSYFIARHNFRSPPHTLHLWQLCKVKLKSVLLPCFLLVLKTFHLQDG